MIIALVNRKGGVSKTTSSGYLAAVLKEAGRTVTGIDTDPEKGWKKWHDTGALPYPVITGDHKNLGVLVREIEGDIIIDTPPNDGEIIYKAALLADEVIVPIAATGHDVNRLASTLITVADIEQSRGKPLASVLLTRWRGGLTIGKEVLDALTEREIPILDARIRHLTRYESFTAPEYLDEYRDVLKELEVI